MGNLGAQKEKRNDTPISAKKDIMGDKTVAYFFKKRYTRYNETTN
ncbi:TPA: hypothetical protein VB895_000061 [Streptococcus suis]|nr:hypothetical protein [Streptococcus suis]HEP1827352.1 hypothetical protein [Streptococcus suis]